MPYRVEIQQPNHEKNGPPPRASLLGIPGEMRNGIYALLFPDIDKDITKLQVLLTCRQIYHEATLQAFKLRRFVIHAKDGDLDHRLNFLSQDQKDLVKIVERPGQPHDSPLSRHFYLAIEKHLQPSCLLVGSDEVAHLFSAIVRIESLTHVFAYSSRDSMRRLIKWNADMRQYHNCSVGSFKESSSSVGFSQGTNTDCVLVGPLQSSSCSFVVQVVSGSHHRDVTIRVPRYSFSSNDRKWEYHMDGISTWLPAR